MLGEALDAGWEPEAIFATAAAYDALAQRSAAPSASAYLVSERSLAQISDVETPSGIVAVFGQRLCPLDAAFAAQRPVALLAGIADPGNAGTLIRSAEAFGFAAVVFLKDGVEPYNPKVVRASMGAIFRLRVALGDPGTVAAAAGGAGFTIVGTSTSGTPLPAVRFPARPLVAVGNERHGLERSFRYDLEVAIPQRGRAESLNAAVAGSIIFYACMQQLHAPESCRS